MGLHGKCRSKERAFWENGEEWGITVINNFWDQVLLLDPWSTITLNFFISLCPHFTVKKKKAQRGKVTYPQTHKKGRNVNLVSTQRYSIFPWTWASQHLLHTLESSRNILRTLKAGLQHQGFWTRDSGVRPRWMEGAASGEAQPDQAALRLSSAVLERGLGPDLTVITLQGSTTPFPYATQRGVAGSCFKQHE